MNNWKNGFKLINGGLTLYLLPGTYEYKFLINHTWIHDRSKPTVLNNYNTNNIITVSDANIQNNISTECSICSNSYSISPGIKICYTCNNIICYDCSYKIYDCHSLKKFTPGTLCCPFCKTLNNSILARRINPNIMASLDHIRKGGDMNKNYSVCSKCKVWYPLESSCSESNDTIADDNGNDICENCSIFYNFDSAACSDADKIIAKRCPGCLMYVVRTTGCNRMEHNTRTCRCKWCYNCGGTKHQNFYRDGKSVSSLRRCNCGTY